MFYQLFEALYEIYDYIRGNCYNFISKRPVRSKIIKNASPKKYAIFCIYDKENRPDIRDLMLGLRNRGFGILAVTSHNHFPEQYSGLADVEVTVAAIGRDFFSYQQGFETLKTLTNISQVSSICFFNDSVWYFQNHQESVLNKLCQSIDDGNLVSGTIIIDEIPHVSGWFFGLPLNEDTLKELDKIFEKNFARKSRMFNIRYGEHKILSTIQSVSGFQSLDDDNKWIGAYAYCYKAITLGEKCFYLKADGTIRTNPSKRKFNEFMMINSTDQEYYAAMRWITIKADGLLKNKFRMGEILRYRKNYFNDV